MDIENKTIDDVEEIKNKVEDEVIIDKVFSKEEIMRKKMESKKTLFTFTELCYHCYDEAIEGHCCAAFSTKLSANQEEVLKDSSSNERTNGETELDICKEMNNYETTSQNTFNDLYAQEYIQEKMPVYLGHDNLNDSMLGNSDSKLFTCEECDKQFQKKYELSRHMLCHSDWKPFTCDICEKSYKRNCHLKDHMLTHCYEKPYACVICMKTFTQKYRLKEHMSSHSNEKPFSCKMCEKSFKRKRDMNRHIAKNYCTKNSFVTYETSLI